LFAVREGRIGAVKALLKAGVDVNEAVQVRAAAKLPEEGARPLRAGTTPLLMAVSNAHFELAAQMLDAGADPNAASLGYAPCTRS
jgi:ankyrin repeat protein